MKKSLILLSLILLLACSSDDDSNPDNNVEFSLEEKLLGTWQLIGVYVYGTEIELEEGHCLFDNKITYKTNNEITYNLVSFIDDECTYIDSDEFWIVESENTYISVDPGDDSAIIFTVDFVNENEFLLSRDDFDEGELSVLHKRI